MDNQEAVEHFYQNMDIKNLLQVVCKDLKNIFEGQEYSENKLQEHFIAANELLSRVEINHSYHNKRGENIMTPSGYCLNEISEASDKLRDMSLCDGELIAYLPLGTYLAARDKPEIVWN